MKYRFLTHLLKILVLLTIGFISLVVIFQKPVSEKLFTSKGEVTSSEFGINFNSLDGESFQIGFPLNDFYYQGAFKSHLFGKISANRSQTGTLFLWNQALERLFTGKNEAGRTSVDYKVSSSTDSLELTRTVTSDKNFDAIGEGIVICQGCFVTDDKKRIYFNDEFLSQDKIELAKKLGFVPVIVGESQFFPSGIQEIRVINSAGNTKLRIPVSDETVFLQENWHLVEFRKPVIRSKKAEVKQTIYL